MRYCDRVHVLIGVVGSSHDEDTLPFPSKPAQSRASTPMKAERPRAPVEVAVSLADVFSIILRGIRVQPTRNFPSNGTSAKNLATPFSVNRGSLRPALRPAA